MSKCTRGQYSGAVDTANTQERHLQSALPTPKARNFELPGDHLHYAPDRPADVKHVKLEITLDFEQETIAGTASTTFSALYEEVKTVSFDAVELQIKKVALENGPLLQYSTSAKKLIVTLDRPYRYGETFLIVVEYWAKPRTGLHFMKPVPEEPQRPVHAWTFGQPRYHSHWFPCHDAPNDRATTEISVTVPAQFQTISNGDLLEVIDHGTTRTHHWLQSIPHAAYLVSLVVGDFALLEDSYNGKPVTYHVFKDRREDAPLYMGKTPEMMRFFSEYTGVEYPYSKFAQTVVSIYTGAMEHTTCVTHSFALLMDRKAALDMSLDYVPIVAHELAHQWFGDLVTCRDWPNGWLNEGFATYFEKLWIEHDSGGDEFMYSMLQEKQGYLAEDAIYRRPIVYYVYHDQGFELFDRHLYNKGGWVLHMLRHQLGEPAFKRAIRVYLERFRVSQVVTSDLQRSLEEVTGRSLERFFQQWIYSGGHPELEASYAWNAETKLAKLSIKQVQKLDELTPCFCAPLELVFTIPAAADGKETRSVPLKVTLGEDGQVEQTFYLPLEAEPLLVRVDPGGWLLKTLKFECPIAMLRYQLAHDPEVLGRVEAADALGDQRDDESLQALANALHSDTFWGVRASAAQALGKFGSEKAQVILLQALEKLDPQKFSRVREAVARALGNYQAPQQAELAQKSAGALHALLAKGDASYLVEAASAEALGRTRAGENIDFLVGLIERPSWIHLVQQGIFKGLGQSGEERVADVIASYLNNPQQPHTLRRAAAAGFVVMGEKRALYSAQARARAVTALIAAVEHDSWVVVRMTAARALGSFGEQRAIDALESAAASELDDGAARALRVAAHRLRTGGQGDEQLKQVRKDLDELREENRKLQEQLSQLQARSQ